MTKEQIEHKISIYTKWLEGSHFQSPEDAVFIQQAKNNMEELLKCMNQKDAPVRIQYEHTYGTAETF